MCGLWYGGSFWLILWGRYVCVEGFGLGLGWMDLSWYCSTKYWWVYVCVCGVYGSRKKCGAGGDQDEFIYPVHNALFLSCENNAGRDDGIGGVTSARAIFQASVRFPCNMQIDLRLFHCLSLPCSSHILFYCTLPTYTDYRSRTHTRLCKSSTKFPDPG